MHHISLNLANLCQKIKCNTQNQTLLLIICKLLNKSSLNIYVYHILIY